MGHLVRVLVAHLVKKLAFPIEAFYMSLLTIPVQRFILNYCYNRHDSSVANVMFGNQIADEFARQASLFVGPELACGLSYEKIKETLK